MAKLLDGRAASDPQLWRTNWYATVGGFVCSVVMLIAVIYGVAFVWAEKSAPATLALVYLGFVL